MKGVYILIIKVNKNLRLKVGSLGKINFGKGVYVYIGTAQNNLEKRIARHKSKKKKTFWHIDYLLNNKSSEIKRVFFKKAGKKEECITANKFLKKELPILKFGCSDCKCRYYKR